MIDWYPVLSSRAHIFKCSTTCWCHALLDRVQAREERTGYKSSRMSLYQTANDVLLWRHSLFSSFGSLNSRLQNSDFCSQVASNVT